MRQVFSSTRLENVEGVARLLEDAGIEVRISDGRSYKGGWGGRRTYNDSAREVQPAVWVVKSDDQPRARQLLRDAGLLESTSRASESYLGPSLHQRPQVEKPATAQRRALRAKVWLLLGIGVVIALVFNLMRQPSPAPALVTAPGTGTLPADTSTPERPILPVAPSTTRYTIETPPALAAILLAAELRTDPPGHACASIDGAALASDRLPELPTTLHPPQACEGGLPDAPAIDVRGYTTDGSGRGTVEVAVTTRDAQGSARTETRRLDVQRTGTEWQVVGPATPR
jgi:hypothetical protein